MKLAVINFSGNVGKSTIARHLLLPRVEGADLVAIESLNAEDTNGAKSLRGRQFGELQEYLLTVESCVVDIGASNVEELMALMHKFRGSHEDFDCFVVPTVPALKQQQDTIATLVELSRLGVPPEKLKVVFNMVEDGVRVTTAFEPLTAFIEQHPIAQASPRCRLGLNELYARLKSMNGGVRDVATVAGDDTDYKAMIARTSSIQEKFTLAQALGAHRLALGVLPELDACFDALDLVAT